VLIVLGAFGCSHGNGASSAPAPSPTLPVTTGDYPAYGHAPDFAWVSGRLVRSVPDGRCSYVVFATHRGEPWGGRIALTIETDSIARFPNGDMVVVTGALDERSLSTCGEPTMKARSIEEH
jgi:hypothetical protein